MIQEIGFALDSPLEGNGFELSVPRQIGNGFEGRPIGPTAQREEIWRECPLPTHLGHSRWFWRKQL
jgi:hypothetical protein